MAKLFNILVWNNYFILKIFHVENSNIPENINSKKNILFALKPFFFFGGFLVWVWGENVNISENNIRLVSQAAGGAAMVC
jgi:hypothetical protein